jgi:hypothetical protein
MISIYLGLSKKVHLEKKHIMHALREYAPRES